MKKTVKSIKSLSLNKVTVNKLDKNEANTLKGGRWAETRNTQCECPTFLCG